MAIESIRSEVSITRRFMKREKANDNPPLAVRAISRSRAPDDDLGLVSQENDRSPIEAIRQPKAYHHHDIL